MLKDFVGKWKATLSACNSLGGESGELIIRPPASDVEIAQVERHLGRRLPTGLRTFFAEGSSYVELQWLLPDDMKTPFRGIFSGHLHAKLSSLSQLAEVHASWIRACFEDPNDPYNAVWHNKLPLIQCGNSDFIAIDSTAIDGAVIYLSHDDGPGHGHILGRNFLDFLERYSDLGCVGPEDWQWLHFWSTEGLLDAHCSNAILWRKWLRLTFPDPG